MQNGWSGLKSVLVNEGWRDNVFIERLWPSLKYEEVWLTLLATAAKALSAASSFSRRTSCSAAAAESAPE